MVARLIQWKQLMLLLNPKTLQHLFPLAQLLNLLQNFRLKEHSQKPVLQEIRHLFGVERSSPLTLRSSPLTLALQARAAAGEAK